MIRATHHPERTCVGCFKKFPQTELLAIRRLKNGSVVFDVAQKKVGRSVYLCQREACFLRATKRKGKNALAFGLKVEVREEVFEELKKFLGIVPNEPK